MNANINADELRLLAYLHEHAEGYGRRYHFDLNNGVYQWAFA